MELNSRRAVALRMGLEGLNAARRPFPEMRLRKMPNMNHMFFGLLLVLLNLIFSSLLKKDFFNFFSDFSLL